MAHIDKHVARDGKITYRFKVYRGRDPVTNKQLAPYSMTWDPPASWSEETCDKKVPAEAAKFEQKCKDGKISTGKESFYNYAKYVIECKIASGKIKNKTKKSYYDILESVRPHIGYERICDITAKKLNKMYQSLLITPCKNNADIFLSSKTVLERHRFVSSVLSFAVSEGELERNIAENASPPKPKKKKVRYYQPNEIIEIARCLDNEPIKWRLLVHLLLITGARRGEIIGLSPSKIDFNAKTIKINSAVLYTPEDGIYEDTTKEDVSHIVKVPDETIALIREYIGWHDNLKKINGDRWIETGYLFTQDNGKAMHPDSLNSYLDRFAKKYNLGKLNPHAFRHTMASLLYYYGFDSVTVAGQLGHKQVSTTENIYAHIIDEARSKASECIADVVLRNKNKDTDNEDSEAPLSTRCQQNSTKATKIIQIGQKRAK